ncbi:MAG: hypothetical protein ACNA7V_12450 [Bacteroidales bacterium]
MIRKCTVWSLLYLWSSAANPQNAPISALSELTLCQGSLADVAVTVKDFNNIGAISLTWHYDPAALSFLSFTNNSGFPGLMFMNPSPGVITASGFSVITGITLPDNAVLFTAHFTANAGTSALQWFDNGESCEYTGPPPYYQVLNDVPQDLYYIDGVVNALDAPGQAGPISGPVGGNVCQGQADVIFFVDPLANATGYNWTLPEGCQIISGGNTHSILVLFAGDASSGALSVFGFNECGDGLPSLDFPVNVNSPPEIIVQPVSPDTVIAGQGSAVFMVEASGSELSFQWQEYANEWTNLTEGGIYEGVHAETLTISDPPEWMDGYKYRCIVSGFCDPPVTTDGLATLTVLNITGLNDFQYLEQEKIKNIEIFLYPNPFSSLISIEYYLFLPGEIIIEIINPRGKKIARYVENHVANGSCTFSFSEKENLPGIYIVWVRLKTNQGITGELFRMIKLN